MLWEWRTANNTSRCGFGQSKKRFQYILHLLERNSPKPETFL